MLCNMKRDPMCSPSEILKYRRLIENTSYVREMLGQRDDSEDASYEEENYVDYKIIVNRIIRAAKNIFSYALNCAEYIQSTYIINRIERINVCLDDAISMTDGSPRQDDDGVSYRIVFTSAVIALLWGCRYTLHMAGMAGRQSPIVIMENERMLQIFKSIRDTFVENQLKRLIIRAYHTERDRGDSFISNENRAIAVVDGENNDENDDDETETETASNISMRDLENFDDEVTSSSDATSDDDESPQFSIAPYIPLDIDATEICCFCHEPLNATGRALCITHCSHKMCEVELVNWLQTHETCPICRSKLDWD